MLPALPRIPDVLDLINKEDYFVLLAPRQSGKTTTILSLVNKINLEGVYHALYCSMEDLRDTSDYDAAMKTLTDTLIGSLKNSQVEALRNAGHHDLWDELKNRISFRAAPLNVGLREMCNKLDKDLVVFFDDVDAIADNVLSSFLSQLRIGHIERDEISFPRSIALISTRNIIDYQVKMKPNSETLGSICPFNIIKKVLTLSDFTPAEIASLYVQHSEASGQIIENQAVQRTWYWTEGQPWLVNAIASETLEDILSKDYSIPITVSLIDQAAGNLMRKRTTHIDSLPKRLAEPGVRGVIERVASLSSTTAYEYIANTDAGESFNDALQYCIDLGLLKKDDTPRPANRLCAGVIMRYLSDNMDLQVSNDIVANWMDGNKIHMDRLLKEFQNWWAANASRYQKCLEYNETSQHVLLSAFLQRVLNVGATIAFEYVLGRGRADIVLIYNSNKYVIELKIKDSEISEINSVNQLLDYMDAASVTEGWLIVFDVKSDKKREQKIFRNTVTAEKGKYVHILGC
ncbi:MAG: PD-(D/E)XK nuclease domain-containing protein [Deltaproteobacteria bacterium]|jgi:hypothetical protein|nr:PD-(D/E)XK nuclease domain-containing protein [Deltaproteobacteria bacterium]